MSLFVAVDLNAKTRPYDFKKTVKPLEGAVTAAVWRAACDPI
jgi:hypothetical protein